MQILHAHWSGGVLCVWGEREAPPAQGEAANGAIASGEVDVAPAHPFALDEAALREAVGRLTGGADGAPPTVAARRITLRLPTAHGAPMMSPRLAHAAGHAAHDPLETALTIGRWSAPALALGALEGAAALERLEDLDAQPNGRDGVKLAPGPSTLFFAAAARLARSLAAEQRFVPMVLQEATGDLRASWRPWLGDESTSERVAALLASTPPIARAAEDSFNHQPWPMLEDFLNTVVDAQCRRALDAEDMDEAIADRAPEQDQHVAWLAGLLDGADRVPVTPAERSGVVRQVRQWISRLDDRGADTEWRLRLSLTEPVVVARAPGKAAPTSSQTWRLGFHLQSVDGEEAVIDAEEIWSLAADSATVGGRRVQAPQELLLGELGRASRLYAPLEAALEENEPTGLDLNTRQAYTFLREIRPLLIEQGFVVSAPAWWESPTARLGVRLEVDSAPLAPGESGSGVADTGDGRLGLGTLVDYRWRIAVGDTTLTLLEFEKLAASREPLVQIEGRWVEVRPEDVQAALEFVRDNPGGQMRITDALRLAYGADPRAGGAPIVGLDATGWVASVFGPDRDQKLPMLEQPEGFVGTLRPYQAKGMSWLSFLDRFGLGAVLADDMGLGKTIQLLALLVHEREERAKAAAEGVELKPLGPTLLVAPTSVVGNWRREARRFAPALRVMLHHGVERLTGDALVGAAEGADLVLTTYALAHRDIEHLSRIPWRRIVLDEAQNIKNPSAKQTQSLRSLDVARRIALTGTPVENRLTELWSIMEFCNPGYLGPMAEFRRRYSLPIERRRDQHRGKQLRGLVQPFILRRLKSDPNVTADLPDKLETKEYSHLTAEQAALYEAQVKGMLAEVDRAEGIHRRGVVLSTLIRLKQICNHPANLIQQRDAARDPEPPSAARSGKAARLLEMLDEVIAAGDQALVFTQFRRMGHLLASMIMHDLDREALFLHGGTPAKAREQMVDRFQRGDGSSPIFILSLKAGGLGMNLTAANHVFHFDRWWNPAVENQATDRAHRIGQTRTVHVHKFIVAGTLEERIDQMIEQKTELADNIIASGERWLTELSTSQLRDLLTLRADALVDE